MNLIYFFLVYLKKSFLYKKFSQLSLLFFNAKHGYFSVHWLFYFLISRLLQFDLIYSFSDTNHMTNQKKMIKKNNVRKIMKDHDYKHSKFLFCKVKQEKSRGKKLE